MGIVKTVLLVTFVIISIILILLVLVQNEEDNGMGSAFGGGNSTAFGARSASVLTKTTGVFVALFFLVAFGLSFMNKTSKKDDLSATAAQVQGEEAKPESSATENWLENEIAPAENAGEAVENAETSVKSAETSVEESSDASENDDENAVTSEEYALGLEQ